jgi:hypothetical protein
MLTFDVTETVGEVFQAMAEKNLDSKAQVYNAAACLPAYLEAWDALSQELNQYHIVAMERYVSFTVDAAIQTAGPTGSGAGQVITALDPVLNVYHPLQKLTNGRYTPMQKIDQIDTNVTIVRELDQYEFTGDVFVFYPSAESRDMRVKCSTRLAAPRLVTDYLGIKGAFRYLVNKAGLIVANNNGNVAANLALMASEARDALNGIILTALSNEDSVAPDQFSVTDEVGFEFDSRMIL